MYLEIGTATDSPVVESGNEFGSTATLGYSTAVARESRTTGGGAGPHLMS